MKEHKQPWNNRNHLNLTGKQENTDGIKAPMWACAHPPMLSSTAAVEEGRQAGP